MDFYHGSFSVFARPNPSLIKDISGMGTNEYGWGFYVSTYHGDAWEHLHSGNNGQEGLIYKSTVEDDVFEKNWLQPQKPIGDAMYQRLMQTAQNHPDPKFLSYLIERKINADTHGGEIARIAKGYGPARPKAGADFLSDCGIQGYLEGSYAVFYKPQDVPLEIYQSYGEWFDKIKEIDAEMGGGALSTDKLRAIKQTMEERFGQAFIDVNAQWEKTHSKRTGGIYINDAVEEPKIAKLTVNPAPVDPIGLNLTGQRFMHSGAIASEALSSAVHTLQQQQPDLADAFKPMLLQLHIGKHSQTQHGFDSRQKVGYAITRAFTGEVFGTHPGNFRSSLQDTMMRETDPQLYDGIMHFYYGKLIPAIEIAAQRPVPQTAPSYPHKQL